MNWQNHCGIFTAPIRVAAKFNIPLIIWGEIAWDISGMFEPDDFVEFSARVRHEHGLRGFEWYDFIGDEVDKITEKDMIWAKYPSDEEILQVGIRGLYIGNFLSGVQIGTLKWFKKNMVGSHLKIRLKEHIELFQILMIDMKMEFMI